MSNSVDLDADIEALDDFLMSDKSPPNCMMLCELDGFLTGIAVGPEVMPPAEWLPFIWRGEEPIFSTALEAQSILGTIIKIYNQILVEVEHHSLSPIFVETPTGEVVASDWAEGFMEAVRLRPKAWDRLLSSDDYSLIVPIAALCCDEDGESLLGLEESVEDSFFKKAGDIIPQNVIAIADYWRRNTSKPIQDQPEKTVVQDTSCLCGSNKHYKKCCGVLN